MTKLENTLEMITVLRLFRSAGHNFFGRHGLPPKHHPMVEVQELHCVAGRGIEGDRFFDYQPDYKGQITFFSSEVLAAMCQDLGFPHADPSSSRRNVLTAGCDLNRLIGHRFQVQGIWFEGTEECRPCYWMDRAFGPGAEAWLRGSGGLRARILSDGKLHRQTLSG